MDGNCLFRAILHQLGGTENYHASYRSQALQYIQENPEMFNNFLLDDDTSHGSIDLYVQQMSQDGVWGGRFEMIALSNALHIQIVLFQDTKFDND